MTGPADDLLQSPALAGFGASHAGAGRDAIDGIVPRLVIEPATAAQAAAALAWASAERLQTVVRGSGTKLGWGRVPAAVDVVLSTARLNRVLVHRHGDLTATIEAGATLAGVNRELSRHKQWLPLASAFEDATIGGLVAANESGPPRHRYGTPRDLLIGITLATTDGQLVKAGGHVVKNVAGYDLGKLMSGSFGAFALIVDATFKLSPLPQATSTIVATYADGDTLGHDAAALTASTLEPAASDVHAQFAPGTEASYRLLVGFATSPSATLAQTATAERLLRGRVERMAGDQEAAFWRTCAALPWSGAGVIVRAAWLPAALPQCLSALRDTQQRTGATIELAGRTAIGSGFILLRGDDEVTIAAIEQLRARADVVGHIVLLRAPLSVKRAIDVWGPLPDTAAVTRALKQAWDPAGILNAGRGPV
jgi:glycolate oxidase FAD binding subunit